MIESAPPGGQRRCHQPELKPAWSTAPPAGGQAPAAALPTHPPPPLPPHCAPAVSAARPAARPCRLPQEQEKKSRVKGIEAVKSNIQAAKAVSRVRARSSTPLAAACTPLALPLAMPPAIPLPSASPDCCLSCKVPLPVARLPAACNGGKPARLAAHLTLPMHTCPPAGAAHIPGPQGHGQAAAGAGWRHCDQ